MPDAPVDITGSRIDLKKQFNTAKPSDRKNPAKKNSGRLLREYETASSMLYSEAIRKDREFTTASADP